MKANQMLAKRFLLLAVYTLVISGPNAKAQETLHEVPGVIHSLDYTIRAETFAEGLDTAWGLTFLDQHTALVTERVGNLRVIQNGKLLAEPVADTPQVWVRRQGGLLDVAAHPDYRKNGWIYLSYSHPVSSSNGGNARLLMTKVVRGQIKEHKWVNEQVIFEAPPSSYSKADWHYGGRLAFDDKGHLFITVGDRGDKEAAQSLSSPKGKVHRILLDGSIPKDNPFLETQGALQTIFSYGHRNPQGLSVHPVSGKLWEAEHGPRGGDELNIVSALGNYGWPLISYGINYDGSILTPHRAANGKEQPIHFWRPSIGASGISFYQGEEFPLWQNNLLVSGLATSDVRLLTVAGDRVLHEEVIFRSDARPYSVVIGPDDAVYVVLSEPGHIVRLSAIKEDRQ